MPPAIWTLTDQVNRHTGKIIWLAQTGGLVPEGCFVCPEKDEAGKWRWSQPYEQTFPLSSGHKIDFILSRFTVGELKSPIQQMSRSFMRVFYYFNQYIKIAEQLGEYQLQGE